MTFYNIVRSILELLYFISAAVLGAVGILGLRQLQIAKESLRQTADIFRQSARRDAYRLAAEQSAYYMNNIIPLVTDCKKMLDRTGLSKALADFEVHITDRGIEARPPKESTYKSFEVLTEFENAEIFARAANALEGFSVLFISGVADEVVAFTSVGTTFCLAVTQIAPILITVSNGRNYMNLLNLYIIWQSRIDKRNLEDQRQKISDLLGKTQEVRIKPIGT